MKIGSIVKVDNPYQINYNLKGIVIENDTSSEGIISKVKFKYVECWYLDKDLKEIKKVG